MISNRKPRSLPLDLWPQADRRAWTAACEPAQRLKAGGRAGHLKPVTRDAHCADYGNFLGFLDRSGWLERNGPAAANVVPEKVSAYIAERKDRVASTTLYGSISNLRRVAQYITPGHDFTWLAEIDKDLALVAQPRSKFDRFVLPEVLIEAGLALIQEAEDSRTMTKLARAYQFRNGLMVALLAFCPIRRKNFAALEVGRSFIKIKGQWWIILSAAETKERRADERPVDELLTPIIDRYLAQHHSVLARSEQPSPRLWLSAKNGAPLPDIEITSVIQRTTLATVGMPLGPHMFRTSAVSAAALHAGDNPHLGSAVLHHTDPRVANTNYNRATCLSAAESLRQIVRQYEKK